MPSTVLIVSNYHLLRLASRSEAEALLIFLLILTLVL
nr:MAG TPA: hypothetical protein [Caudoviricetes sp.]